MTITVYQIYSSNADVDRFNAGRSVPSIEAWRMMMFGARKWNPEYAEHYSPVYEIDTDDLNTAFEVTNLWNNGHLVRALDTPGRSTSVGDIFVRNGFAYIVDNFGFAELGPWEKVLEVA
jgi:hypothetical protein